MNKTFIDTFFVAPVNERDFFHERAIELSIEYERKPVLITDAVLLEVGNSLTRTYKKESILIIERFLSTAETEVVRLDETLFDKAFTLYKNHADKSWELIDCVSFVVMREYNVTDALTNDKHFAQAGFRALMLDAVN